MSSRVGGNDMLGISINPLCANFAYVMRHNYWIDFDQASVK